MLTEDRSTREAVISSGSSVGVGVGVAVAVASFVGVTVGSLEGAGVSVGVFSSPLSFLSSLSWLLLAVSSLSRKCETPK
ncbi:hypothetical protein DXA96_17230 [Lachnospiraceae bacterium OF09-33XD]|nr:hypothetical protein DXA96_17230 [Lachnospiraceae bacterium OF09-33XD]